MICDVALDLAATKIVQHIAHPGDDLAQLHTAARLWLQEEMSHA